MQLDIFLINSIIPIMLAFVLWVNSSRTTKAKRFLCWAMLNAGISFFITHQYMSCNYNLYIILHPIGVATILFIYPSFHQYVAYLTGQTIFNYRSFLPGAIFGIVSSLVFWGLLNEKEQIYFLSDYRTKPSVDNWALQVNQWFRLMNVALIFGQIGWYYFKTNRLLNKYHTNISNVFSDVSHLRLSRVKILNISFIVAAFACVSFYLINPVKLFGTVKALEYPFFLLALILSLLGAIGVSQTEAPAIMLINNNEESTLHEEECEQQTDELFVKINRYLQQQQPFLESGFTIMQLATAVGSNRTYISNCINRQKGLNFSQFINTYRLDQAKQMLMNDKEVAVSEIAIKSGFGSASAFSRAFKELEKTTPSEFRDQNRPSS